VKGFRNVVSVAAGEFAGYALLQDGSVWAWGIGSNGLLGNGDPRCSGGATASENCPSSDIPVEVKGLRGVVAISAGGGGGYALTRTGSVWAWGSGIDGELGNGDPRCTPTVLAQSDCPSTDVPVQVKGLSDIVEISGGDTAVYALTAKGVVWSWGSNGTGQLGNGLCSSSVVAEGSCSGSDIPVRVEGLSDVVGISAGGGAAYAIRRDRSVWAWGDLGLGAALCVLTPQSSQDCPSRDVPVQQASLSDVAEISGSLEGGYALRPNGTILAWGSGSFGQLGNGRCASTALKEMTCPSSTAPVGVKGDFYCHFGFRRELGRLRAPQEPDCVGMGWRD
jgi:alpha-tubulin suppressor-like RCC1 family protein